MAQKVFQYPFRRYSRVWQTYRRTDLLIACCTYCIMWPKQSNLLW